MPAFSVALTEDHISMRNLDSGSILERDFLDVPDNIYKQIKNEVRTTGLKKPICSSRIINLASDSPIYLWFLCEKSISNLAAA